ncbi:hypothetical protein GGH91_000106 [Coemansia sp. RSA 2671]|nr:hypothetical protein LPJ60_000210 [Coemansia sp. RSA 2675]KAJ2350512.1 hypothetical protein GGH91_000106 [Coemansia sp. RSA 2671]KAJ2411237.1 hypothetical protein GGI10_004364 [Coemansia sp. RSA 2530]
MNSQQPLLAEGEARGNSGYLATPALPADDTTAVASTVQQKGSATETFFHIVCISAGTGILQLPYALKQGGWIGALYIILAAAISAYTGNILVKCLYHKQGTRLRSYSEVVEAAFGRYGRVVARGLKDFNLLGVAGIFIVLAGININALVSGTPADSLGPQFWIAVSSVLVWLVIVMAREIHDVFVLSVFGTLTTVVMVLIIVWLGISDLEFVRVRPPTKLVDIGLAPMSLASICFSFGGNLNWPDLEASMQSPKRWSRTLALATAFIAFIYLCVAVVGYGVYGDLVKSPVLLSLPPGIPVVVANAMITAHVLLACPIILTAVFIEAENDLGLGSGAGFSACERIYSILFRTAMMLVIAATALLVSDFSKIVTVLGAIAASMVVFVIPVACYVRLFQGQRVFSSLEYAWCTLIAGIGLLCLVIGTSQAVAKL